jgi:hypothetical protein
MKITLASVLILCGFLAATTLARQSQQQTQPDPHAILQAQRTQTEQLAATWLRSVDPRLQAWGAYLVLHDEQKQFIPDLLSMLSAYQVVGWPVPGEKLDQHDAMLAVLDSLIQLSAKVPAGDAEKLLQEFPAQSLILLSREGNDANDFLMKIFTSEPPQPDEWLAAGNLLAQRGVSGFASTVLGKMTVHTRVRVANSETPEVGTTCLVIQGFAVPTEKRYWPKVGTYTLGSRFPGATLLADGPDPAFYSRAADGLYDRPRAARDSKRAPMPHDPCLGPYVPNLDLFREHYLIQMAYAPQDPQPLFSDSNQTLIWKDRGAFLSSLRYIVRQRQDAFADLTAKLMRYGRLTSQEASAAKPQIEITMVDARTDMAIPLPTPGNLGDKVTLKM